MRLIKREAVARVEKALKEKGASGRVEELAETARSAEDAASACGVPMGAIVKTLIFSTGRELIMALIAGDRRCNLQALQQSLQLNALPQRAKPAQIKAETGFTIGGVSPVGCLVELPTAIDASLARFDPLVAAAGHPHCVFRTSYHEMLALTGAIPDDKLSDE